MQTYNFQNKYIPQPQIYIGRKESVNRQKKNFPRDESVLLVNTVWWMHLIMKMSRWSCIHLFFVLEIEQVPGYKVENKNDASPVLLKSPPWEINMKKQTIIACCGELRETLDGFIWIWFQAERLDWLSFSVMNITLWSQRQANCGHRDGGFRGSHVVLKFTSMVGGRAQGEDHHWKFLRDGHVCRTFKKREVYLQVWVVQCTFLRYHPLHIAFRWHHLEE